MNQLPSIKFDLHMHTTASDGIYSPSKMVQMAKEKGLQLIAITDHDTLDGLEEARQAGEKFGITVIPGVEISTKYNGTSIDILGYHVNGNERLQQTLQRLREGREERALRIIRKFAEIEMPITLEEVKQFSKGGVIARPHIAQAIVQKGYVSDYQTVFDEYLADGKPCALDKTVLSPADGIELIHQSGGQAVLAHPVLIGDDLMVRELLEQFDFDGIEVWHRKQNRDDQQRYQKMAEEFDLMMTGGSDFHNDEHELGEFGYPFEEVVK